VNGSLNLAPFVALLALVACNGASAPNVPTTAGTVPESHMRHEARAGCPQLTGRPTCLALIADTKEPDSSGCTPSNGGCGYVPSDLQTRYDVPSSTGGSGVIVAIVDAFDQPDAASDLAVYRSTFGLGTANFTKYNENGEQYNYPESCSSYSSGGGWCVEEDLDIEMVSAMCPSCTIDLIEGDGSTKGFEKAEATAVSLGAHIVSNSWICYGSGTCGDKRFGDSFDVKGVEFLAGSGDAGYGHIGAPSALPTVVAVGGTQLHKTGSSYSETIWGGAGGGCADKGHVGGTGIPKPAWQHDSACANRTDADISATAGCSPGVAEYDGNEGGWFGVCGTSVAGPVVAGVYALAGNAPSRDAAKNFWRATHVARNDLHPVKSGSDGSCGGAYLCTAGTKQYHNYSGPGGWGTPYGLKAF
jgi:subtilase family serine protease